MNNELFRLVVCGISHRNSTISEREIFQINRKDMQDALKYFQNKNGIEGVVVISTCNRIEFYLVIQQRVNPLSIIRDYYLEKNIDLHEYQKLFYTHNESEVAAHLFKVICGLDSMLLGEYQIQGQIKEAYSIACSFKSAEKILHKLFHAAFRIGKNIRSQTKIGSGKQSLSGVAFHIIKEKLSIEDKVAIIGVNQSTKIIAKKLNQAGFQNLVFINRTLYKAEELANKFSCNAFNLKQIEDALNGVNCIFSSTGSPGFIINSDLLNIISFLSKHLKLIIDMAIPRDIDSNGISEDIEFYDLEGLKTFLDNQKEEIVSELPIAEKIISDEVKIFEVWSEYQNDNTIAYFNEKVESIRLQLLDEAKLQNSEEEIKNLDKFSRSLVHRLKSTINQVLKTNDEQTKTG